MDVLNTRSVVQVILPVLDEASALPWVLGRFPSGFEPIVVDNGSSDGSGDLAARLGAQVVGEPRRGFGAACHAGLCASRSDVVCFMDCDASLDPRDLPRVADPVLDGSLELCLGARVPEPGAWPLHARIANAALAAELRRRTGAPLSDLGPMRGASRAGLLTLGIRDLRLAARDGAARRRAALADRRAASALSPPDRRLEGDRHRARRAPDPARHDGGAPVKAKLVVIAKAPRPGRCKTRLAPPLTLEGAARVARGALLDTLATALACSAREHVLALDGPPAPWIPAGFRTIAQRGDGLDERLAAAFEDAGTPAVLIGMDTPQVTAALLSEALAELEAPGSDAVIGPALDGGYWAIGLLRSCPELFHGVPMSRTDTFKRQLERLRDAGLCVRMLPPLRDVDRIDDARAVAALAPGSRFARELAAAAA
jgi:rSAM/selenodomain-associated transferase 1